MTPIQLILGGAAIVSALSITKSSNKNQVDYAVQLNGACVPAGPAPVHPYWRMLEKGASVTEELAGHEQRAYGIARQEVDGDTVHVVLRSLPTRPIAIRTWRTSSGSCASEATANIDGVEARLDGIYVKLKFLGVDYVQLSGTAPSGAPVQEKLSL